MIRLDLNNPEFEANLLKLDKQQAWAVLQTLRLLQAMTWRDGEWLRLLSLHQFVEQGLNDRTAGPHEQRSRATLPQVKGPLPIAANKLSNAGLFELLDA